jgi:hypothetical protein
VRLLPAPLLAKVRFVVDLLDSCWEGELDELVVVDGRKVPGGGDGLEAIWRTLCTICSNSSHLNVKSQHFFTYLQNSNGPLFGLPAQLLPEAAAAEPILLQELVEQLGHSADSAFSDAHLQLSTFNQSESSNLNHFKIKNYY